MIKQDFMLLQILPPDSFLETNNAFDTEVLFVILALAAGVFLIVKTSKYLSTLKGSKKMKRSNLGSFLFIFFVR
jgi:hypothetical protein